MSVYERKPSQHLGWSWQSRLYCAIQFEALGVRSVRYWLFPLYAVMLFGVGEGILDNLHRGNRQSSHFSLGSIQVCIRLPENRLFIFWQLISVSPGIAVFVTVRGEWVLCVLGHHRLLLGVLSQGWSSAPQVPPGQQGLLGGSAPDGCSFALWLLNRFCPLWLKCSAFLSVWCCGLKQCHRKVAVVAKQNLHPNLFDGDDVFSYVNDFLVTRKTKTS